MEVFFELSILIFVTTIVAGLMWFLRQPLIIGYIVAGVIVGPLVLNIMHSTETLTMLSHVGISLLLFIVGLNLRPKVIRDVGKVSVITGVGQVAFTSIVGFIIAKLMGFSTVTSAYLAVALTFSSTIIIMKLLSDKASLDALYGRIAIGFLIVQDLIAVIILMVISSTHSGLVGGAQVLASILKGVGLLLLLFVAGVTTLPKITRVIAKSQEYLMLFSLSWCLVLSSIFYRLGFSMEIGAILAGITLSVSP
ncbi:MAG: cation:proton antiporter, partial [Candidatus Altiarchaeota archaeon]